MSHGQTIYIEGTGILENHFSGVGQYILGILRALDQILADRSRAPKVKVMIPFDKTEMFRRYGFQHLEPLRLPIPSSMFFGVLTSGHLPPLDSVIGRGVYIFPRFLSSRLRHSPSVPIIYDLSYALYTQYADSRNANQLLQEVPETLRRSQAVITISENSRKEIMDFYGVPGESIVVASPAADPTVFFRREAQEIAQARAAKKS